MNQTEFNPLSGPDLSLEFGESYTGLSKAETALLQKEKILQELSRQVELLDDGEILSKVMRKEYERTLDQLKIETPDLRTLSTPELKVFFHQILLSIHEEKKILK